MKLIKNINILVDNESWIIPYAEKLSEWCIEKKIKTNFARHQDSLVTADVSFFLGCTRLVTDINLAKSQHNLVVHESPLPSGKGFAPVAWQILEGKNTIPVCLIEASKFADSGDIWLKGDILLDGTELYSQWRDKQGEITISLCQKFIKEYEHLKSIKQEGQESFYARRTPLDSQLDINKTLAQQFNLLRVVDNDSYPAFFNYLGKKFKIEITSIDE